MKFSLVTAYPYPHLSILYYCKRLNRIKMTEQCLSSFQKIQRYGQCFFHHAAVVETYSEMSYLLQNLGRDFLFLINTVECIVSHKNLRRKCLKPLGTFEQAQVTLYDQTYCLQYLYHLVGSIYLQTHPHTICTLNKHRSGLTL